MKPRLFRVSDIFPVWIFALLAFALPIIAYLSNKNNDTWGGEIPIQGWLIVVMFSISSLFIFFEFYFMRWQAISQWAYTTTHGIVCYYEPGTHVYLKEDVEKATEVIIGCWKEFKFDVPTPQPQLKLAEMFNGASCFFTKSAVFVSKQLGYKDRKVYGISGWNWMRVGQGDKPIEHTAYMHECSHLCLNFMYNDMVDEDFAHQLFKVIGV